MTKVNQLEEQILLLQKQYYNGTPAVTDGVYDTLIDELKHLNPGSPVLTKVGVDDSKVHTKVKHLIPMGSQEKANSPEEIEKWLRTIKSTMILVEYKLDGASLELVYSKGILQKAITRGDGIKGDDITNNAKLFTGVRQIVAEEFTGSIRGEVLCYKDIKEAYFPEMANCRNVAAGVMKRLDGVGCKNLNFVAYDLIDQNEAITRESRKIEKLAQLGFNFVHNELIKTSEALEKELLPKLMEKVNKSRKDLNYDIDGLVIKSNTIDHTDLEENLIPKSQIAYKFPREEVVTKITAIEWSVSNGTYTPMGIIEPIHLCGTTVTKATLCNVRFLKDLGVYPGEKVIVTKRGEIIPKIEQVVANSSVVPEFVEIPNKCFCCSAKLVLNENATKLFCKNPLCRSNLIGNLTKWLDTLEIKELGERTLEAFINDGLIDGSIGSLYELDFEQVAYMEGFGEKSAEVIKQNLFSVKEVYLSDFIAGLNIEGIGSKIVKKIIKVHNCKTFTDLLNLSVVQLEQVDGVGEAIAIKLKQGLVLKEKEATRILHYVSIKDVSTGSLNGLSVCFTGSLSIKRSEAEKLAKQKGMSIGTVSKDLTYLVTNNPEGNSSKLVKARKLGIQIIDEVAFMKLLGEK